MSVRMDVEEFYGAFYPRLVTALFAMTRDRHEAEDAAQEAFARLLSTHGLERLSSPEAWLYTVGVNVLRSRWRAVQRARRKARRH
ncbi:MAG: RNA polymerase sigma factor [Nocardioidaceae bacterium]